MIQLKRGLRIIIAVLLTLAIFAYIAYAIVVSNQPSPEERCKAIELNFEENLHAGFLNSVIIEAELRKANIYPIDRLMSDIRTRDIEQALSKNDFVEKVECYKTANNKIAIDITQRTPVIYVLPDKGRSYYVDQVGKIIAKNSYPVNMPVATGNITEAYAKRHLSRLGTFIVNDKFWNGQIEQIHVSTNKDKEYVIDLIPRVGDQMIHLGQVTDFENKLKRLMVFYKQAMPKVGWNKYSILNLEYKGQVICKK